MSEKEIRDLLDLGVADLDGSGHDGDPPLTADEIWTAGRRLRTRGRSWGAGLGAAAAAAGIIGIAWAHGLGGGDTAPPPADTTPGPTVEVDGGARGEPYLRLFHRDGAAAAEATLAGAATARMSELNGASDPASLAGLQGRWRGENGESFALDGHDLTFQITTCQTAAASVTLSPAGRLTAAKWDVTMANGPDCDGTDPELTHWSTALPEGPLLTMDGQTLLVSGLDGTSDQARVPVVLTLEAVTGDRTSWRDAAPATDLTPITLGEDVELLVSGVRDGRTQDSIHKLSLKRTGACPHELAPASLRFDGILLSRDAGRWSGCSAGEADTNPSEAVLALLTSAPAVGFDDGTMVISGTIPEALLPSQATVGDGQRAGRVAHE